MGRGGYGPAIVAYCCSVSFVAPLSRLRVIGCGDVVSCIGLRWVAVGGRGESLGVEVAYNIIAAGPGQCKRVANCYSVVTVCEANLFCRCGAKEQCADCQERL